MAELSEEEMRHLATLCRIHMTDKEMQRLHGQLQKVLLYVEQLQEIDTEDVEPCNQVIEGVSNVMREDEVGETLPTKTFLSNAPSCVGNMIRTPPVIQGHQS